MISFQILGHPIHAFSRWWPQTSNLIHIISEIHTKNKSSCQIEVIPFIHSQDNGNQNQNLTRAHFTINFPIVIKIWRKFGFSVKPLQLSGHVQNFVAISLIQLGFEQRVISIKFELQWENCRWNYPHFHLLSWVSSMRWQDKKHTCKNLDMGRFYKSHLISSDIRDKQITYEYDSTHAWLI